MALQAAALGLLEGRRLRRLGTQERLWHQIFTRSQGCSMLVYSLIIESDRRLQPEMVRVALTALQRQYPMLCARVQRVDGADHLVAGPCAQPVPLTVLPAGGDWLAEHHRQLRDVTVDPAREPMWKAALLHEPSGPLAPPTAAPSHRAVLYLSIAHTITDGASNSLLLGRLLEQLERRAAGGDVAESAPAAVPPPVDELAARQRLRPGAALLRAALATARVVYGDRHHALLRRYVAPLDPARPASHYWNQLLPHVLSLEETAQLRALCRQHGVTVNAALSAAVSVAAARLLEECGGCGALPADLPTFWMVNLRRYLPEARAAPLCAGSALFDVVHVRRADGADFWQLAGQVHDKVAAQLECGWPLWTMRHVYHRLMLGGGASTPDDAPPPPPPPPAVPSSMFLYNINNMGALDGMLGRSSTGSRPHVRAAELHRSFRDGAACSSFGAHCFQTVAGRLCYDYNFVRGRVTEPDAARFSGHVMDVIRQVTAEPDTAGPVM